MSWPPPEPITLPAVDAPDLDDEPKVHWLRRRAVDIQASLVYRGLLLAVVIVVFVFAVAGGLKAFFLL